MNKKLLPCLLLLSGFAFAANPWDCVNALGASNNNDPTSSGCNGDAGTKSMEATANNTTAPSNNVTPDAAPTAGSTALGWLFADTDKGIRQCKITNKGLNVSACQNIVPSKVTAANFSPDSSSGMTINNNMLYATSNSSDIVYCKVNKATGIDGESCKAVKINDIGSIKALTVVGNTIFIAQTSSGKITTCPLTSTGSINNASCNTTTIGSSKNIKDIKYANGKLYLLQEQKWSQPYGIVQCGLSDGALDASDCETVIPSGSGQLDWSNKINVTSSKAYVYNNKNITQCNVSNGMIVADSCQNYTLKDSADFKFGSLLGDKIYASEGSGRITQCNLSNGNINAPTCTKMTISGDAAIPSWSNGDYITY